MNIKASSGTGKFCKHNGFVKRRFLPFYESPFSCWCILRVERERKIDKSASKQFIKFSLTALSAKLWREREREREMVNCSIPIKLKLVVSKLIIFVEAFIDLKLFRSIVESESGLNKNKTVFRIIELNRLYFIFNKK
jgi:hypothetical protein